jgi:hypothetical protein
MGSNLYRMSHRWVVRGPIETVFRYVGDSRTYLDWFTVFKEVRPDNPTGPIEVGSHSTMRVKALLPYSLDWDVTVARHEPPTLQEVDIKVSLGGRFGMHGRIRFSFEDQGDGTVVVTNAQEIRADKPLPGFLEPLAQAAFAFNHRSAMNEAQRPLQAIVAGASASR